MIYQHDASLWIKSSWINCWRVVNNHGQPIGSGCSTTIQHPSSVSHGQHLANNFNSSDATPPSLEPFQWSLILRFVALLCHCRIEHLKVTPPQPTLDEFATVIGLCNDDELMNVDVITKWHDFIVAWTTFCLNLLSWTQFMSNTWRTTTSTCITSRGGRSFTNL